MDALNNISDDKPIEFDEAIAKVTEQLFLNNIQGMLSDVITIIERVQYISKGLEEEGQLLIGQIIQYIMLAMENKDYLLISDILTYELLPVINKLSIRGESDDGI